jgi:flagellar biogenesis protein FliO
VLIGVKMTLVFVLLGGTLWFLRRHDRSALISARRTERPVAVLAQAKVGKTSSVALVRIGTEAYAIGVTEQNVSLLLERPVAVPDPASPMSASGTGNDDAETADVRNTPAMLGAAMRAVLGRRSRVEYLDVALPAQGGPRTANTSAPGTDGPGSSPSARTPEPVARR